VHLHTSGANPKSWMLAQICALTRAPIVTLHSGLLPRWLSPSPARRALARTVLQQYSAVVAVSDAIRDALAASGFPGALVLPAFLRDFVKPGAPPPGLLELRAEAAPLFCAMVAPDELYGLPVLLRAFAQVLERRQKARLALYGRGSDEVRAAGVRGFGELHRPQALALMAASDVFVRPTLVDGDSVSVREALALGRRVVATSVGNRPAGVRLVPPKDAAALAQALLEPAEAAAGGGPSDSLERILSLYEVTACAASAAS
jgi:glycogen synthase